MDRRTRPSALQMVLWLSLAGAAACSNAVRPGDGDGGGGDAARDASQEAGACTLPSGALCPAGQTCPAGDGCNVCACQAGGSLACTLRACADAGDGRCRSSADCASRPGTECVFEQGCAAPWGLCQPAMGECFVALPFCGCNGQTYRACRATAPFAATGECLPPPPSGCATTADCPSGQFCDFEQPGCGVRGVCRGADYCTLPEAPWFCGCDGRSFQEVSNCVHAAYVHAGPCEFPDAGAADGGSACEGAALGPTGVCQGPTDGPAPAECCWGYACRPESVTCSQPPPACQAGYTASVSLSCWGPCVPTDHCAP